MNDYNATEFKKLVNILFFSLVFYAACFIPSFESLRPFHVCLLIIPFIMISSNIRNNQVIILLAIFGIFVISLFYSISKNIDNINDISNFYAFFPLFLMFYIFFITKNLDFSDNSYIYKNLRIIMFFLSLFIILQINGYQGSFLKLYMEQIETSRFQNLDRYVVIYAPFENKNTVAYVIGIILLSFMYNLAIYRNKINVINKIANAILITVLLLGLLFTFSRTIYVSLSLSLMLFFLISKKKSLFVTSILMAIAIAFFIQNTSIDRFVSYYGTILSFNEDLSYTARYEFWYNALNIIDQNPFTLFVGFAANKMELFKRQGHVVIDSGIIYYILNNGGLIFSFIVATAIYYSFKYKYLFVFFMYVLISNITLALVTDYRSIIITGMILGLVVVLERNRLSKEKINKIINKNKLSVHNA